MDGSSGDFFCWRGAAACCWQADRATTLQNGIQHDLHERVQHAFHKPVNWLTNLTHQAGTTNLATYSYQLHPTGRRTNALEILRQEDGSYLTNTLTWKYD